MGTPIDCGALWDKLPADEQRRVGVAALVYGLAAAAGFEPIAMEAAAQEAGWVLEEAVHCHAIAAGEAVPRPDLAAIGVRACLACGCTEACACPEGCHWVDENLCSSCDAKRGIDA